MTIRWMAAGLVALAVLAGCAGDDLPAVSSSTSSPQPVSLQLLQVAPELRSQHFSDILNFEMPTDPVFLEVSHLQSSIDHDRVHTGRNSLRLEGGHGQFAVRISSLLSAGTFPGNWTLAGAYFISDRPARVIATVRVGQTVIGEQTTTLPPNQWTAAMVEMLPPSTPAEGTPSLVFAIDSPDVVWCDDVILIDNTQWLYGDGQSTPSGGWNLRRSGYHYICDMPGVFNVRLLTAEADPQGWKLEEANSMRMRFSSTGDEKALTIWSDGRSYRDGHFRALTDELKSDPLWQQQEVSPAEIQIPEEMGRLERRSPGDENNDGYNETRGTYMIVATGPRLDVTVTPRSVAAMKPTLEITGLPQGKVLATLEGQLIEQTVRLDNGTLLVQIPTKIDRAVTVNIRVQ